MLEIKTRSVDQVTVLDLSGSLIAGSGTALLSQRVKELVAEQKLNIVINAKDVSVIDSSGVGDLVGSFSLAKKSGGSLKVANPSKMVREVLRIARIPTIIEVFDTEEAALKAFEQ